jgi:hypothetical protein
LVQSTNVEFVGWASGVSHTGSNGKGARIRIGNVGARTPSTLNSKGVSDTLSTVDSRDGRNVLFTSWWRRWRGWSNTIVERGTTTLVKTNTDTINEGLEWWDNTDVSWTPSTLDSKFV